MAVNAELVEVKGWYRGIANFSLLYSIRSRKFIKGFAKSSDIIYNIYPGKYVRFEYNYLPDEDPPNLITIKLVNIKKDGSEEVITSTTIRYGLSAFLGRFQIPQIIDFERGRSGRWPYKLNEIFNFNKIYDEEENRKLISFVMSNANINERQEEALEDEELLEDEEIRKGYAMILKYRDDLERLYKLYEEAPIAYVCPFCGHVSYRPLNVKVELWVRTRLLFSDDFGNDVAWGKKAVDFCDCPKCKTTLDKCKYIQGDFIDSDDLEKIRAKKFKVMTKEYKQLLNDIRAEMKIQTYKDDHGGIVCEGDGFRIYESGDEVVCETSMGWDYCLEDLPEDVGKLVWAIYYLVAGQVEMIDEEEVNPE